MVLEALAELPIGSNSTISYSSRHCRVAHALLRLYGVLASTDTINDESYGRGSKNNIIAFWVHCCIIARVKQDTLLTRWWWCFLAFHQPIECPSDVARVVGALNTRLGVHITLTSFTRTNINKLTKSVSVNF